MPLLGDAIKRFERELEFYDIKYLFAFKLGIYTGLRVSDLTRIKVKDLRSENKTWEITETKTKKIKVIPLTDELIQLGERVIKWHFLKEDDYIIVGQYEGTHISRSQIYRVYRRIGDSLGIKNVGTHALRKTYAMSLYLQSGGNIETVRQALNHKYTDTTLINYIMSAISPEMVFNFVQNGENKN